MRNGCRAALSALALVVVAGCAGTDANFRYVRDTVLHAAGERDAKTVLQLSVGPGLLWLGGTIAGWASHEDEAAAILLDIRTVQIGVYELQGPERRRVAIPLSVERRLAHRGYEPIVKVKGRGEATLILAQLRKDRLKGLFVVAADGRELVLVEIRGRLERVLEQAVRERGLPVKHAAQTAMVCTP